MTDSEKKLRDSLSKLTKEERDLLKESIIESKEDVMKEYNRIMAKLKEGK